MTVKEKLIQELEQTPDSVLSQTLAYLLTTKQQQKTTATPNTIWELAQEFTQGLSEEELNKIPTDGALQHDHYIYGTEKIKE